MASTTRMPTHCSACQKEFSEDHRLFMWMAEQGDDVADAWHKECFTRDAINFALARRGIDPE